MFNGVVAALEAGELSSEDGTSGALDLAWQINGATEYGYYNFSPETNDMSLATLHEETNPDNLSGEQARARYLLIQVKPQCPCWKKRQPWKPVKMCLSMKR